MNKRQKKKAVQKYQKNNRVDFDYDVILFGRPSINTLYRRMCNYRYLNNKMCRPIKIIDPHISFKSSSIPSSYVNDVVDVATKMVNLISNLVEDIYE